MDLAQLLALSAAAGGLLPFLAAVIQQPGAGRWNLLVRLGLALLAGGAATLTVCGGFDLTCLAASVGAVVATAESTYRAWTQPVVDPLFKATSPGS